MTILISKKNLIIQSGKKSIDVTDLCFVSMTCTDSQRYGVTLNALVIRRFVTGQEHKIKVTV